MPSKLLLSAQKRNLQYSRKVFYLLYLVILQNVRIDRETETDITVAMYSFLRLAFLELYFREN